MKGLLLTAFLVPLVLMGCAADSAPEEGDAAEAVAVEAAERSADEDVAETRSALSKPVPFCPAGEVRKCTLGPPPVCHCEPLPVGPVFTAYAR